ncbi:MAG TPA: 50S ribosomal protein L13 [Candidatus Paceibacterota bacterium]|nr:50S ribosomal protein L13 [Candidatus Paceibacterota bacterium]
MQYTVDATGKTLGRLASDVASKLMGKGSPTFMRNKLSGNAVTVTNAAKLKVAEQKLREKTYIQYSGYPGGQKIESMQAVITKKGYGEAIRKAVKGMLPDNKLKNGMMKQLTVTE